MEQNNNYEPVGYKVSNWFFKNMWYLVVIAMTIAYASYKLYGVEFSFKVLKDIVADSLINLVWGFGMTTIFGNQGIVKGQQSDLFTNSLNLYGNEVEKAIDRIDDVPDFCDEINNVNLITEQTKYLQRYRLKYSKWISGEYETEYLNKQQKKALDRVDRVKIFNITPDWLLSNVSPTSAFRTKAPLEINKYRRTRDTKNLITKSFYALFFGSLTMKIVSNPTKETIIFTILQLVCWLFCGYQQFLKDYNFMVEDYRNNVIIKKINLLTKFNGRKVKKEEVISNG